MGASSPTPEPIRAGLTVWKFPFVIADRVTLEMPAAARLTHFDLDPNPADDDGYWLAVWALVDPKWPTTPRRLIVRGTGHPIDEPDGAELVRVGTAIDTRGGFVWHCFEEAPHEPF